MAKIKEIRKIEPKIKEVKKENQEATLEEEVIENDTENFTQFIRGRRPATATLDADEAPQERIVGPVRVSKEDEAEMHFRPSYVGGGNPYQDRSYSTQMEGSSQRTSTRGESGSMGSTLRQEPTQQNVMAGMGAPPPQNDGRGAGRAEQEGGRQYAEGPKKEKRNAM